MQLGSKCHEWTWAYLLDSSLLKALANLHAISGKLLHGPGSCFREYFYGHVPERKQEALQGVPLTQADSLARVAALALHPSQPTALPFNTEKNVQTHGARCQVLIKATCA